MKIILDYVWLDGKTISDVKYLTKVVDIDLKEYNGMAGFISNFPRLIESKEDIENIPSVIIDGSNISQESSDDNDVNLKPIKIYLNPLRSNSYYVICEVYDGDIPHSTNSRGALKNVIPNILNDTSFVSIKENFIVRGTTMSDSLTNDTYSSNRGDADEILDDLLYCSLKMNLPIEEIINKHSHNNVWEIKTQLGNPIHLADDIVIIRHLLYRISKKHNKNVSFDKKYFTNINSEKDKINDPYLLIKKILKTLPE